MKTLDDDRQRASTGADTFATNERSDRLSRSDLSALVTAVAHDMRNPLGAMLTTLHVLERNLPGDPDTTTSLQRLRRGVDRCERTLVRLTDYLRISELEPQSTRLDNWLAAMLNAQSVPDDVSLVFRAGLPETRVTIDRRLVERALRQLIENAVEALRADGTAGTITVSTRPLGDAVEIRVVDNGPGVPAGLAGRIFEPLVGDQPQRIGLGLAIAQQDIGRLGGSLSLEPVPRGACFVIRLPVGAGSL